MSEQYRGVFRPAFALNVRTGLVLLAVFTVLRVALVLQANVTGSYSVTGAIFFIMALLPFVLLTRAGRRQIGIVRPRWRWLLPALAAGVACALAIYGLAVVMYGGTAENPFVYISRSYSAVPSPLGDDTRLMFFLIFAAIGVTFSPLGEELFYRGLVHESLAEGWGNRRAALAEAAAFAIAHLAHFGVVYLAGAWGFLPLPALLWVAAMFGSALVFYGFRVLSGSVIGAIVAHAGFNLAMNYVIFFVIL